MKNNFTIIVLLISAICIVVIAIIKDRDQFKEIANQSTDFTQKLKNIECGESFFMSELTHYWVVYAIKNELAHPGYKVRLGKNIYKYIGINYNTDGKKVYWVNRDDESLFEIRIFDMEVAPGGYTAKFVNVDVICK